MIVIFCGDQVFIDFVWFLIHNNFGVLYTWCLRYNICRAWLLDIRLSTCFDKCSRRVNSSNFFSAKLSCYTVLQNQIAYSFWGATSPDTLLQRSTIGLAPTSRSIPLGCMDICMCATLMKLSLIIINGMIISFTD